MALVCRSWFSHFKKNWINYNYLSIFEFKKFGNIQQIKKIFEISRLPHIKKIKQLFQGQKLETFFQKSEIKIKTPNQILNPVQGNLLEQFSIRPKKSGQSLFLTDKNLNELLELSRFSMHHISLGSCHFLTEKSIQKISICKNLKSLVIQNNSILDNKLLELIVKKCNNLKKLKIPECNKVKGEVFTILSQSKQLQALDFSKIKKLDFTEFYQLAFLPKLNEIIINYTQINCQQFQRFLDKLSRNNCIYLLSMEGCYCFDDTIINIMIESHKLQNLNALNIQKLYCLNEENVYKIYCNFTKIRVLLPIISSKRIEQQKEINKMENQNQVNLNSI